MPTRKFDVADYLRTNRQIAAYLDAALADGDPRVLLEAVRDVAAVRGGMTALARRAGIPRESLYRMLSRRKPRGPETAGVPPDGAGWTRCLRQLDRLTH